MMFKRCLKKQSGQPLKDREKPFQLGEIGAFQVAKGKADFVPRGGVELVQHEIRRLVQAVLLRGQAAQADQRKITECACDGNHGYGRVLVHRPQSLQVDVNDLSESKKGFFIAIDTRNH